MNALGLQAAYSFGATTSKSWEGLDRASVPGQTDRPSSSTMRLRQAPPLGVMVSVCAVRRRWRLLTVYCDDFCKYRLVPITAMGATRAAGLL